jgi:O-antigen/teichoic acid export membrane protein
MSRVKNIARGVMSGYLVVAASIVLSMGSIPVALKYLSREEFGLWAVVSQLAGFLGLIDLGMSAAIGRLLIDYKDNRGPAFGSMVKTCIVVSWCQGAIVGAIGLVCALVPPSLLGVPDHLGREFFWLLTGQTTLLFIGFQVRVFVQLLYANQRMDWINYSQVMQFLVQFACLWVAFALGAGVYGQLIGAGSGSLIATAICITVCLRLKFWPAATERGPFSREKFREIFHYGADLFAVSLGSQLIVSSQTILASRLFGIDAAAIWAVATKAFSLVFQFIWRIWAAVMPAFAEMQAQGDVVRIQDRYRSLFVLITTLSAVAAVAFAACNGPFLALWTGGKIGWAIRNDWLLALWLMLLAQVGGHGSLIMALKQVRALKWVYFGEGLAFVIVCLAIGRGGFSWFLGTSVVCTAAFTLAYGTRRIAGIMNQPMGVVALQWQKPMLKVLAWLGPVGFMLQLCTASWQPIWQLLIRGAILGGAGCVMLLRFGITGEWIDRMCRRLPPAIGPWFKRFARVEA